jgi:hypothetical protein
MNMTKNKIYPVICAALLSIGRFCALLAVRCIRRTKKGVYSLLVLDCWSLIVVFRAWYKKFSIILASLFYKILWKQVRHTTSGGAKNILILCAGDLGARAKSVGERSLMTRQTFITFLELQKTRV